MPITRSRAKVTVTIRPAISSTVASEQQTRQNRSYPASACKRQGCIGASAHLMLDNQTTSATAKSDTPLLQGIRVKSQLLTAPNQITLLRLIFIPFVIMAVFDGHWPWALGLLIAAGLSDALDGLLARALHQQTMLGQYLDPIADKLLLTSLFVVLSFVKKIPWKYTVLVFSRDVCIVATAVVLYATVGFRDFRPSIFGKINTVCQIAAIFFVVLAQVLRAPWVIVLQHLFLYATFTFTVISGVHYILVTGHRLRKEPARPAVPGNASQH